MDKIIYDEITCEKPIVKLKRIMPYSWDINIYRGCEHGCKYCYAIYSHKYTGSDSYCKKIYVKTNLVEQLERQLSNPNWKHEVVNIGGVTDSYQPAEAEYKLMPEVLKLFIKYKTPAIISTKSDLILRDYDLIDELSKITYINVAATITTMDENIRKLIEPGGVKSHKRFDMLKAFKKTNASVGLHIMPIIPFLTDNFQNIDLLLSRASECNVHYILPGVLYLRGQTRKVFLDFIKIKFPDLHEKILALYKRGKADKEYKDKFYKMFNELKDNYSLSSSYSKPMKEKLKQPEPKQVSLI